MTLDPEEERLIGEPVTIHTGSDLGGRGVDRLPDHDGSQPSEGTPITFGEGSAGWIDENRAVVGDQNSRNAYVHDLRSGSARVLPGIPVPGDFTIGDGGRTLIFSRTRLESDIWMLSLGE